MTSLETVLLGTVEPALIRVYGVPKGREAAFHSRTTGLQKLGLFGHTPGKGRAMHYGPDQVHRLIFACELFEFGVSPSVIIAFVASLWDKRLRDIFRKAEQAATGEPGPGDIVMHMGGVTLMAAAWTKALPNVNACPLHKLPHYVDQWMKMGPLDPAPRAIIVNLTARLRAFQAALEKANRDDMEKRAKVKN